MSTPWSDIGWLEEVPGFDFEAELHLVPGDQEGPLHALLYFGAQVVLPVIEISQETLDRLVGKEDSE